MRLCDLRQKEVINIKTCSSMGCVVDVEIDPKSGCIQSLIVPGPNKFSPFLGRDCEIIIAWEFICQIGKEIILVDMPPEPPHRK